MCKAWRGFFCPFLSYEMLYISTGLLYNLISKKGFGVAMSYLALYRKYRPSSFDRVKGQDHIVTTLKNQLRAGHIGHAYLFCGTRGTGKTSIAKLFAKAVNCEHPVDGSPCGECSVCRSIADGTSMNVIEIDAASNNGVDSIRQIVDEVKYSPTEGNYKVYIIDEVHMLSTGAFNALLKTLEEPPSYVIFILATTEVHKIPVTILSRCQRYDFRRISVDTIAAHLAELMESEGIKAEEKALRYVARTADGSMRDAESLLDQCIAFYMGEELTYEKVLTVLGSLDIETYAGLFRYTVKGDVARALKVFDDALVQGREPARFIDDFISYIRNILIARTTAHPEQILEFSKEQLELILNEAASFTSETLIRYIRILSELSNQLRYATQKRVLVEVALIKLCKPQMEIDNDSLAERIRFLEEKLESGSFVAGSSVQMQEGAEPVEIPDVPVPVLNEELTKIAAAWDQIVANIKAPLFATEIRGLVPTATENNELLLVFQEKPAPETGQTDILHDSSSGKPYMDRICEVIRDSIYRTMGLNVAVVSRVEKPEVFRAYSENADISSLVAPGLLVQE